MRYKLWADNKFWLNLSFIALLCFSVFFAKFFHFFHVSKKRKNTFRLSFFFLGFTLHFFRQKLLAFMFDFLFFRLKITLSFSYKSSSNSEYFLSHFFVGFLHRILQIKQTEKRCVLVLLFSRIFLFIKLPFSALYHGFWRLIPLFLCTCFCVCFFVCFWTTHKTQ